MQTTRAEIVRRWQGLAGFRLVIRYKYLTTRFVVEENGISYFISNVSGDDHYFYFLLQALLSRGIYFFFSE